MCAPHPGLLKEDWILRNPGGSVVVRGDGGEVGAVEMCVSCGVQAAFLDIVGRVLWPTGSRWWHLRPASFLPPPSNRIGVCDIIFLFGLALPLVFAFAECCVSFAGTSWCASCLAGPRGRFVPGGAWRTNPWGSECRVERRFELLDERLSRGQRVLSLDSPG